MINRMEPRLGLCKHPKPSCPKSLDHHIDRDTKREVGDYLALEHIVGYG